MASDSNRNEKGDRAALPFEPKRGRKKDAAGSDRTSETKKDTGKGKSAKAKKADKADEKSSKSQISAKAQARVDEIRAANRKRAAAKSGKGEDKRSRNQRGTSDDGAIPKVVSNRMLRRMAILSMGPIALGVSIFFIAYYLLSHQIVEFAPVVVLLTTMGCFGLGVVGLTYGMLSASWDEEPGSLIGLSEFKLNLGRMVDAWKESRASKT